MKRLLLSATAIAIMIAPAMTTAAPYQGQAPDYRSASAHPQPAPREPSVRPPVYQPAPHYSAPQRVGGQTPGYAPRFAPQGWAGDARARYPAGGSAVGQYRAPSAGGYQVRQTAPQYRTAVRSSAQYGREAGYGRDNVRAFARGANGYRDGDDGRARQWWNGRQGFEAYEGRRDGYWYAPGRGYYRPGAYAYGYGWGIGAFVPYDLRSYYVEDPYDYGVGPAPYGYRWIFLDDELVLIDLRTGLIVETADTY